MKKYIIAAIVFLSLGLAFPSCTNPDVSFTKNVSVTVSPYHVLADITEYFSGQDGYKGKETYVDDDLGASKLKICVFVYKSDGNLLQQYESILSGYNEDITVNLTNLDPNQNYDIIAVSFATFDKSSVKEPYTITNASSLNNFNITQNMQYTIYSNFSLLGLGSTTINPSSSSTINLSMKPASALVAVSFESIHYNDKYNIDSYSVWNQANDRVSYSNNKSFSYSYSQQQDVYRNMECSTENTGNNIYDLYYLLPSQNVKFIGMATSGTQNIEFDNGTFSVNAGETYQFILDCESLSVDFEKLSSTKADSWDMNDLTLLKDDVILSSVKVKDLLFQ